MKQLTDKPRHAGTIIAAAISSLIAFPAVAQQRGLDSRIDIQRSRTNAILNLPSLNATLSGSLRGRAFAAPAGQPAAEERNFTFDVIAPLYFNSNALQAPSGATGALEGNPELSLQWAHNVTNLPVKVSALIDMNADRYTNVAGADQDVSYGVFRAQYFNINDDQAYAPFIEYSPRVVFAPTFAKSILSQHDLHVGVDKVFNFDRNLHRMRGAQTAGDAVLSLGFTAMFERRLLDAGSNSYALFLVPSVSYQASPQWNVTLQVNLVRRWYENDGGLAERSWLINPALIVEFQPPAEWMGGKDRYEALGAPVIDLQVSFAQVSSNRSGASFNQWFGGPVMKATWRF